MPLDARMADPGALVRAIDIPVPPRTDGHPPAPVTVVEDDAVARVGELILSHYLPADTGAISEAQWAGRAGRGFTGTTTAGRDGLRRTIRRITPAITLI
jgi:hypothetical protein